VQGFLNLNKPAGLTSHDCVARVRKLLKLKRIGHAGTLDPAAVGVLPIAIASATRLLQFLPSGKAYQATIRLGHVTATDDLEGETLSLNPAAELSLDQVKVALLAFLGTIQQIPPIYSAIQVQGKRLYQRAVAGEQVEAPPRMVEIFGIEVLDWRPGDFPEIEVAIACGPGTYIRAIARDLGQALEMGGTLAHLTRTASCGFKLPDSLTFDALEAQLQQGTFQPIPAEIALGQLSAIVLSADLAHRWCQGQRLVCPEETLGTHVRVYGEAQNFLGIGHVTQGENQPILQPKVVMLPAQREF
jgi:tRNA pseudouridine55 synthase